MKSVLVFAGTIEGREICEYLVKGNVEVTASVVTQYGSLLLPKKVNQIKGALEKEEIADLAKDFDMVIDATHPYAQKISENIKLACPKEKLVRIIRPSTKEEKVSCFSNLQEACEYLAHKSGNILATTGCKELEPYTIIDDYKTRVFVRALPTHEAISKCEDLGFASKNIICMQGPFNEDLNIAMLKHTKASFIVTKDTGDKGGFLQKITAANLVKAEVVLIGRPTKEQGLTLSEAKAKTKEMFDIKEESDGFFPFFVNIKGKQFVIAGGGKIALRRAETLVNYGGKVSIVAPEICQELKNNVNINCIEDEYKKEYVNDAFCVIAATNKREINEEIKLDCTKKGIQVNVADCKEQSDFYFPAVFFNEDISGGLISKNGSHHSNAKKYKNLINEIISKGIKN